jgi:predicted MFS family arabinose efflux permease
LAGLTPPARRHAAFALQRVTRNLGIGLGGVVGGLIATTANPTSFTVLFLLDAATFLVFVGALGFVPEPSLPEEHETLAPGRYVDVLRHRVFLGLVVLNVLFVTAGYAQFELLPVFAKNEAGVAETGIGIIFFVNTLVIVLAQLPVAKALEGRRRMPALVLMCALWAAAWIVVFLGGLWLEALAAAVAFGLAAIVFGLGECFQGPVQGALVADLAPPRLRGRYMAVSAISWDVGFIIGPAIGGFVLAAEPLALWPAAAVVCVLAGVGALALERDLPRELRLTPA